ncbi:MAG: fumarylacetoacetate hydrolase family protein [Myxococcota bacterium]
MRQENASRRYPSRRPNDAPDARAVRLRVKGERKQASATDPQIHDFAELLVYLSLHMTLQPGDVILAGTPAAVGFPTRDFLHLGDGSRIEVEGCSALENRAMEGT